jgi:hypothetical protein
MKVILSLAGKDVKEIQAAIEAAKEINEIYVGNIEHNPNQKVEVVGNTLVVEGERYAITTDAFGDMLLSLKDAIVLKYSTSNPEMYWYENTCSYLSRVNSMEAAVAAIAASATVIPDEIENKIIEKYKSFFKFPFNARVAIATLTSKELIELVSIRKSEWFYQRYHFKH